MLEAANSGNSSRKSIFTLDYKNIEEFIYENINLENPKYAQFQEQPEHSSD